MAIAAIASRRNPCPSGVAEPRVSTESGTRDGGGFVARQRVGRSEIDVTAEDSMSALDLTKRIRDLADSDRPRSRRAARKRAAQSHLDLIREANESTVAPLAAALELRDDETGSHAHRVAQVALAITRVVDPELAEGE